MHSNSYNRTSWNFLLAVLIFSTQGCYQYRVLNTSNDPATEYQKKVMWSYAWGLVNKPKDFHVPNCSAGNAIDELQFSKKFGQSLLTLVTIGFVSPVEVKWKCHKPCQRVGGI
ncbi:MAG: hypothetical protein WKF89_20370 [Chitinophagaceae bacterium]